jgi:hypothetical protein
MNNITKLSIKLFLSLLFVIGGILWDPLGILWDPLGILWDPLGILWDPLGILLGIVLKVTDFLTFAGNIILK